MNEQPTHSSAESGRFPHRLIGLLLVLVALIFNKWSLERLFSADEHIYADTSIAIIVVLQVFIFAAGVWLILRKPSLHFKVATVRVAVLALLSVLCVGIYGNLKALHIIDPDRDLRLAWAEMSAGEELLLKLTLPLKKTLSSSILNLKLPDHEGSLLFADQVMVRDLTGDAIGSAPARALTPQLTQRELTIAQQTQTISRDSLLLWQPLLTTVKYFEHAKFYPIKGHFLDDTHQRYETYVGFYALARLDQGKRASVEGKLTLVWGREPSAPAEEASGWRIKEWHTSRLQIQESDQLLFDDILDLVLSPADLAEARRSRHEEFVLKFLLGEEDGVRSKPHELFSLPAFDRHPGVAIVDIDDDGFDDIYLLARWGPAMLLRNQGNGTFSESADAYGLALTDFNSSAIFADFDNDGDPDVFVGRTLAKSVYLKNEGGVYVDHSNEIDVPMPFFVSSMSAADYDGDGLLDLYISTYAADLIRHQGREAFKRFLPDSDSDELSRLLAKKGTHENLNRPGPPNVLLRNTGSGFTAAGSEANARLFLNSYQSTWADYDRDGDPDLYVANDFSPNVLLRNDGTGKFTDVTKASNTADIGFGMGATWGDYDQDGRQDLYVSNMYSKAGQRITAQIPGIDRRIIKMARGNSLLRNTEGAFQHVSGMTQPSLTVEHAGWSWGSQFADINNDGTLDIFALSGYYTAPGEAEIPVDT